MGKMIGYNEDIATGPRQLKEKTQDLEAKGYVRASPMAELRPGQYNVTQRHGSPDKSPEKTVYVIASLAPLKGE